MQFKSHKDIISDVANELDLSEDKVEFIVQQFWKDLKHVLTYPYLYCKDGIHIMYLGKFILKKMYRHTAEKFINQLLKHPSIDGNHKENLKELLCVEEKGQSTMD